ncbi:hypothetical protein F5146DRAFT_1181625 [Armillaria mellea]|nr:hypothetical protein F5146DRAFT_1181625 [Armillaria mellea]
MSKTAPFCVISLDPIILPFVLLLPPSFLPSTIILPAQLRRRREAHVQNVRNAIYLHYGFEVDEAGHTPKGAAATGYPEWVMTKRLAPFLRSPLEEKMASQTQCPMKLYNSFLQSSIRALLFLLLSSTFKAYRAI